MPLKNNFSKVLEDFKKLQKDLPKIIGGLAVGFAKDNFVKQGFEDSSVEKWTPRKPEPENMRFAREEEERQQARVSAGQRRTRGKNLPKQRGRSILVRTGALKKSIQILRLGRASVVVGSPLPYSGIHNEGGTIIQKPTEKQKAFFYAKFKETENPIWLKSMNAQTLKIDIPKRQFLGDSRKLTELIREEIRFRLSKVFNQ